MKSPFRIARSGLAGSAMLLLLFVFGCSDTLTDPEAPQLAKPPALDEVEVTATVPDSATQDTTLLVDILGDGFDDGSTVDFMVGDVAQEKLKVNSVQFMNKKRLKIELEVAADADPRLYDVRVTTRRGPRGIGTELFRVKEKVVGGPWEDIPIVVTYSDNVSDKISGDGRGAYEDDVCGVRANFPPSESGNVTMDPDSKRIRRNDRQRCGGIDSRWLTTEFTDPIDGVDPGPVVREGTVTIITGVEAVTADSGVVLRSAMFNVIDHCRLWFGEIAESNLVEVSKNANGTWTVRTQAHPNDVAYCDDGVRGYHMPFELTVGLLEN